MTIPEKGLALVVFSAKWCLPCKAYHEELGKAKAAGVNVLDADVDTESALAMEHNVMSVPTSIMFSDGQPVGQMHGKQSKDNVIGLWVSHGGKTVSQENSEVS